MAKSKKTADTNLFAAVKGAALGIVVSGAIMVTAAILTSNGAIGESEIFLWAVIPIAVGAFLGSLLAGKLSKKRYAGILLCAAMMILIILALSLTLGEGEGGSLLAAPCAVIVPALICIPIKTKRKKKHT